MWDDVRFALRTARRSPAFTFVAVASLALGIGANAAIFSLLYQVAMRSLPVHDPGRLAVLRSDGRDFGWTRSDNDFTEFSYPMYKALRDGNRVFSGLTARTSFPTTLGAGGEAVRATAEVVAGDFFGVLGVQPHLGRLLTPADESSANPAIVLGYSCWAVHMARSPNVLNTRVLMNGHPVLIVGVAPQGFRSVLPGQTPDFFASVSLMPMISPGWKRNTQVDSYWLNVLGRLRPGVDERQAGAAMLPLFRSVIADHIPRMQDLTKDVRKALLAKPLMVEPAGQGLNGMRSEWKQPLLVLLAMVGLLLLIACANIAGLLLVRAVARQREIALRFALGASAWQVSRQLLIESSCLAVAGGVAGVLICGNMAAGLLALLPADASGGWLAARTDWRLLAFGLGMALATGIVFGLAPALRAVRFPLAPALKQLSTGTTSTGHAGRTRQAFVAAQIGLSLLLVVGAGLFTRTLTNLTAVDLGFRADRLVTFSIDPALSGYSRERTLNMLRDLEERLGALPQVRMVTRAVFPPFGGMHWGNGVQAPGSRQAGNKYVTCQENATGAGYFRTFGTPLLAGREFTARDVRNSQKVAIVNETFARFLFENENPIGRRLRMGANDTDAEVVGVVKDSKFNSIREKPQHFLYVPFEQEEQEIARQAAFFLRTPMAERDATAAIRAVMKQVDPAIPIERITTVRTMIDESIYRDRLIATLALAFGALATLLAAVGLYGTMSYSSACRTREFGIRLALGAERRTVLGLVMSEAGKLTLAGVAVGLPLSYALARVVQSQFYGVAAYDPWTFGGATLLICGVATVAALVPSVRSMRTDPIRALRYE